jgi:hypothetical protein
MSYPQLQGAATQLIRQPGDQLTEARNGLATLVRSYWCALSYADSARATLVKGYVPSDYPYMGLFTPPNETVENGIAKFQCTFYGVLSTSKYYQPYDQIEATLADGVAKYIDLAGITLGQIAASAGPDGVASIDRVYDNTGVPLDVITTDTFQYAAPTLIRSFVVPASDGFSFSVPSLSDFQSVLISEFNSVITKGVSVNADMRPLDPQRIVTATCRTIGSKRALITDYGVVRVIESAYELTVSPEIVVVGPGMLTDRPIYVNQAANPCTIPVTNLTHTNGGPETTIYPDSITGVVGSNPVRVSLSWGIPSSPSDYAIVGYEVNFKRKYVVSGIAGQPATSNDTFFTKTGGPVYPSLPGVTGYEPGVYECSVASHNVYGKTLQSTTTANFVQVGAASAPRELHVVQEVTRSNVPLVPDIAGAVTVSWGTPFWDGVSNRVDESPYSDAAIIDYELILGSTTHTIPVSSLTSGNHVVIAAADVGEIVGSASLTARTAFGYGVSTTAIVTQNVITISGDS